LTDKNVTFVSTNYYSYAIGVACRESEDGSTHELDWFAWTREKSPALFMRKTMRNIMLENNVEIPELFKGQAKKCWGEDIFF